MFANDRTLIIHEDFGGDISAYVADIIYQKMSNVNKVVIDGTCASACILWMHNDFDMDVCVTKNAKIGWHIPYWMSKDGNIIVDEDVAMINQSISDQILSGMPSEMRDFWMSKTLPSASKGDPAGQLVWIMGDDAIKMIGACDVQD